MKFGSWLGLFATTDGAARRAGARLGAVLLITSVVVAIPTVLNTPLRPGMTVVTVIALAVRPPIALLAQLLPWERWDRRWLMVWPLWTVVGVAMSGHLSFVHGAPALAGLLVFSFFFVGMTQARGMCLLLLPLAVPAWVAAQGGWDAALINRLPIAVGVWLLVGETLAAMHQHIRRLTAGLVEEASTDALTGLGNRRDLTHELEALRPGDAVVVLDLDRFKLLNDRYGHAAGDKVLADLGQTIRSALRPDDTGIRIGGEEILLILPAAHEMGAREVLARLSAEWLRTQPDVTFSAGICVVGDEPPAGALAAADLALYQAKQDGRNCWRIGSRTTELEITRSAGHSLR